MKNIIIFSDGTGQRGGLMFDERRSNVYKLFRATRCGPDSSVNPAEQVTFYDPGLGTLPAGHDFGIMGAAARTLYNFASQATGMGITRNIVDCYAAIIRLWEPGDHIFLFGFSRGAYTVRCLNAVLSICGVPTRDRGAAPLRRNDKTAKRIASEAIKKVYQHTESRTTSNATERQKELLKQRSELASRFRNIYAAAAPADHTKSNAYPYFIGVFDTVASLANPGASILLCLMGVAALTMPSLILAYFTLTFWIWFAMLAGLVGGVGVLIYAKQLIRFEVNLPRKRKWRLFHFTAPRMKFYDTALDPNVSHARHAIAIDEFRHSFERVPWGSLREGNCCADFEQLWFAGNHSDVGGSYLENESRLSDISLKWMLDAAVSVGLRYDPLVLRLYPDFSGPQHDETRSSFFRFFGKSPRPIPPDAPLHSSVVERLKCSAVLDYDIIRPYRPQNLREHTAVRELLSVISDL